MTHKPPVPPENQSPFPIQEPPHTHSADTTDTSAPDPASTEEKDGSDDANDSGVGLGLIAAAVGAVGALAIGTAALLRLSKRDEKKPAPRKRAAPKRKAAAKK